MSLDLAPQFVQAQCLITQPDATASQSALGTIFFRQNRAVPGTMWISGTVTGLTASQKHGFHIHAAADIAATCSGAGGHYNPDAQNHGGPTESIATRHAGDLGNILATAAGVSNVQIEETGLKLTGATRNIIGKAIVVHALEDDLGKGGALDSTTTGAAGARIGCCVITAIVDTALPKGARCNASKTSPKEQRPKCLDTDCCGTAFPPKKGDVGGQGDASSFEVCYTKDSVTAPKGDGTDFSFACIDAASKLASSVVATLAASYLMA